MEKHKKVIPLFFYCIALYLTSLFYRHVMPRLKHNWPTIKWYIKFCLRFIRFAVIVFYLSFICWFTSWCVIVVLTDWLVFLNSYPGEGNVPLDQQGIPLPNDVNPKEHKIASLDRRKVRPMPRLDKLPGMDKLFLPESSLWYRNTLMYFLDIISNHFDILTAGTKVDPTVTMEQKYNTPAYKSLQRWVDRRGAGRRIAVVMEEAIREHIINYKKYKVPFINYLDKISIFSVDKWLYWDYYVLNRINNFFMPVDPKNYSDFVLICQFMDNFNQKYNLTREELDLLLTFKKHYEIHKVFWNYQEWIYCLDVYTNSISTIHIQKTNNSIEAPNRNVELLKVILDMRLAIVKHSIYMEDNYYGLAPITKYTEEDLQAFWRIKKNFNENLLTVNIIDGYAWNLRNKNIEPQMMWLAWNLSLENYNWLIHEYLFAVYDNRFKDVPISVLETHLKYRSNLTKSFYHFYAKSGIKIPKTLDMRLVDLLHSFFYAHWPAWEFLYALGIEKQYPGSLMRLNIIKTLNPKLNISQIIEVHNLYLKYTNDWFSQWWYYFTERRYTLKQMVEFYGELKKEKNKQYDEVTVLNNLRNNSPTFQNYNNDDKEYLYFSRIRPNRWWK